jgi:flavin-dependent dehydrogenase
VSTAHDVCVLGAGPGGATAAALLADAGLDVLLVEAQAFPRAHVGEALSPAIWPLLDTLGVAGQVAAAGFERPAQAVIRWRSDEEERVDVHDHLVVDRARFDAILLERARRAGATVLTGVAARRPVAHDAGWAVAVGSGVRHARFVVDASGRRRVLGGRRETTSPRTLALHACWRGGPTQPETWIEAVRDGWLWGARLPGGAFRALAFVDPEALTSARRDRDRLYGDLLSASRLFARLADEGRMLEDVRVCDATCSTGGEPVDATAARVGEASVAIDPLSSCGVQTAIESGVAAAAVLRTLLAPAGDADAAIAYYRDHQRHVARDHRATAASIYAEHREHADAPFWQRRGSAIAERPVRLERPPIEQLLGSRVRLSRDAAVRDTPCRVGDVIERRPALTHPDLARPVAFLGGCELAPLLDDLELSPTLGEALGAWEAGLPAGRGHAIAAWLHQRRLIEVLPDRSSAGS